MNENYIYYKKLKRSLEGLQYKGYPLDKVLGSYIAKYAWSSGVLSLKVLLEILLERINVNLLNPSADTALLTYSIQRNDYMELISSFIKSREFENIGVEMLSTKKNNFLEFIALTFLGLFDSVKISNVTLIEKLVLNLLIAFAKKNIDILEKEKCEFSKYIAFNSSFKFESFLSYFFRIRGIKTYSLQHGMYFKYLNEIPIDVINFENVCADKLLCWGQYTYKQVWQLLPNDASIEVDCYPKLNSKLKIPVEISNKVLILLPRTTYKSEIIRLINLLISFKIECLIRPHPNMKQEVRGMLINCTSAEIDPSPLLSNTIQNTMFRACIGFNTSSLFEAILYNQNVIQYISGNDEFIVEGLNTVNDDNLFDKLSANKKKPINSEFFFDKCK
jgi:hypothetical protein